MNVCMDVPIYLRFSELLRHLNQSWLELDRKQYVTVVPNQKTYSFHNSCCSMCFVLSQ